VLANDVRALAISPPCESGGEKTVRDGTRPLETGRSARGSQAVVSLRPSIERVADPQNLDESVEEVFQLMLGLACRRTTEPPPQEAESVTAMVGFGGMLSGACVLRSGGAASLRIAAHMTGMEFTGIDDTVKDGMGEICNMLAGVWKGKAPELAAHCMLSVPAVITGRDYNLHVQSPEFQLHHIYTFGEGSFEVTIICDGLQ
jgi:chemotaxis protein CheX